MAAQRKTTKSISSNPPSNRISFKENDIKEVKVIMHITYPDYASYLEAHNANDDYNSVPEVVEQLGRIESTEVRFVVSGEQV